MTVTSLRRARWPMSTTLFVAIVAIVAIVGVGCSDPTSDRLQPSARGTTAARGGQLIGLWADFYAALDASDTDWVTAIPVTLRNNSLTPILIRDVRFEQTVGLDVADVRMIGPQDQALGNAMYLGWLTPTLGGVGNPDLSLETRQLAGYVIPPHSAEQAGPIRMCHLTRKAMRLLSSNCGEAPEWQRPSARDWSLSTPKAESPLRRGVRTLR
ncbi:MAG: hypothetical protein IT194_08550 [Microthrixaceae bacterium]|nr:hypothetical protein [Microthrixaceae bacterium]